VKNEEGLRNLCKTWYRKARQVSPARVRGLTRNRLVERFAEFGLDEGAEIGVDTGRFSLKMLNANPDLKLLCVDPWNTRAQRPIRTGDARFAEATKRLAGGRATLVRDFSVEASADVPDQSLDFVYIDGDHRFGPVMKDILFWLPKIRYGGIIAGHDYYRWRGAGVVNAVDAYTQAHDVHEWFVTDEKRGSWFWVKDTAHVPV